MRSPALMTRKSTDWKSVTLAACLEDLHPSLPSFYLVLLCPHPDTYSYTRLLHRPLWSLASSIHDDFFTGNITISVVRYSIYSAKACTVHMQCHSCIDSHSIDSYVQEHYHRSKLQRTEMIILQMYTVFQKMWCGTFCNNFISC